MRGYVNPIDNIIKELILKKYRIIKAYNSGMFSDKETWKFLMQEYVLWTMKEINIWWRKREIKIQFIYIVM